MNGKTHVIRTLLFILIASSVLSGCGHDTAASEKSGKTAEETKKSDSGKKRKSVRKFLLPAADGTVVYGNETISIDASNTGEGYIMVQYAGGADKVKVQITIPDLTQYTYTLTAGGTYETLPLTGGNGAYHIEVLEHAYDDMYAMAFAHDIEITLNDEFKPFLYPNQYSWYTQDSETVKRAVQLSEESSDDLNFVENVYHYIIENITYDEALAKDIPLNYVPSVDETLRTGKGICFDYAALMTSMLRCQGIPTKLEVGYSGEAYHAWISVYLKETGWVDKIIEFDGINWSLMDPTLAAGNNKSAVGQYIGDGSNYMVKYSY